MHIHTLQAVRQKKNIFAGYDLEKSHQKMIIFLALLAAPCATAFRSISIAEFKKHPIPEFAKRLKGQELVDYINYVQPFFQTNLSSVPKPPAIDLKFSEEDVPEITTATETHYEEEIPERQLLISAKTFEFAKTNFSSFDAREKWPNCRSVKLIRDQANCGSCWAVSTASAMSDRLCIHSNGERQDLLSATDILTCCVLCGSGCNKGSTLRAYAWLAKVGACTGGPYGTQHTAGNQLGAHGVKIIGWGIENGVKYWLISNSWNTDWGEK
ncbi:unnamed protein product, partial [Strongylus vulgaris]